MWQNSFFSEKEGNVGKATKEKVSDEGENKGNGLKSGRGNNAQMEAVSRNPCGASGGIQVLPLWILKKKKGERGGGSLNAGESSAFERESQRPWVPVRKNGPFCHEEGWGKVHRSKGESSFREQEGISPVRGKLLLRSPCENLFSQRGEEETTLPP